MFSSSHVMPSRTFSTLQLILFLLFCNFSLHAWYLSFHTARLFKLMDLTFSPPIIHSWSHFRQVPTKESSHEFSFFFLLLIFANGGNASKLLVDRASQQGGNARTHLKYPPVISKAAMTRATAR